MAGDERREDVIERIRAERDAFSGDFAFSARNLTTGEELGVEPEQVMPTASTIKLCVLAELYRVIDRGGLDPSQRIDLHPDDYGGGSGILKDLDRGLNPTVHDLATLMVALSDNVATAALVRLLGAGQIIESVRGWGMADTSAGFTVPEAGSALDYGASTPRELVHLLALIATDGVVSREACAEMRAILRTQQYNDQIARYLPYNPYLRDRGDDQPVKVGSKSGFMAGIRVDAGIVWLPEMTYAIALMTSGSTDRSFAPEQESMRLNGRVSRLVFDYWAPDSVR